ncbi:MAG: hypothetical protein A2600_10100 [Candidatus Lambdaproteobacteria bacterium RIFOXYD1_FULL_56_27]|uniref:Lipid A biosynthesis acyltransferase n=1 Tax=Candidatus Lambdaproteobacteria bacterium RIFOXYD2_FULL_56_26 TaxID=1817773 RepID=A0A1F6H1W2_9PROT|nr:MAG: hypothetical protein A2426_12360 [Candidatus Lambdaproteobacteria bacterium RIFOXYC1_FULL_56_13]OGH04355.1 MAG: hypothetical protein A2557_10940 [Candidatus Lambdaproteobacteria bacterium RIFOXYD2_FULL_56_26]OGH08670.1 MAG: hypothetical protein A2600_10100 [Candidatus Lambdaproteobacteria bacterium RIFOXYD1_FULL_56_27]
MAKDAQYNQFRKEKSAALKPVRHFAEWLALSALLGLAQALSIPVNQRLGRWVGRVILKFAKKDLGVGLYQLSFALPELDEAQRLALMAESAANVGQTLFEALGLKNFAQDPQAWIELEGQEVVEKLKAEGKGALMLFGHFGNWELIPLVYKMLDIHGVAPESPIGEEKLDKMLIQNRTNSHFTVVPRGTANSAKQMLSCLKGGGFYLMAIDQDLAKVQNLFVDFFGKKAATSKGAANVAQRFGVPVVSIFGNRLPNGRHKYRFELLSEPPYDQTEAEELALTQRYTTAIETHIRANPGQWVWFHRRWKTRPEGEA